MSDLDGRGLRPPSDRPAVPQTAAEAVQTSSEPPAQGLYDCNADCNRPPVRRMARRGPGRPAAIRNAQTAAMVLDMLAKGWTFKEIGRAIRAHPSTVARWVRAQEAADG